MLDECGRAEDRKQAATGRRIAATEYKLKLIKLFFLFEDLERLR